MKLNEIEETIKLKHESDWGINQTEKKRKKVTGNVKLKKLSNREMNQTEKNKRIGQNIETEKRQTYIYRIY